MQLLFTHSDTEWNVSFVQHPKLCGGMGFLYNKELHLFNICHPITPQTTQVQDLIINASSSEKITVIAILTRVARLHETIKSEAMLNMRLPMGLVIKG
jgi:hypothetical protein